MRDFPMREGCVSWRKREEESVNVIYIQIARHGSEYATIIISFIKNLLRNYILND